MEANSALLRLYEREMKRDCGISLSWYDVLIHLSETPAGMMRMSELADALLLSPSWLTRRVDGMEQAGLVRRCQAAGDKRGVCVALTPRGRALRRKASRSHASTIETHFLVHLTPSEVRTIDSCFTRIAELARRCLREAVPTGTSTKENPDAAVH